MTEQPATIAREAKSMHQSLKEILKVREPFDREVDFQRKNLRRRYLHLLLIYPYSKESKDVENHLWMQTSYAFIASYKQRISALDRAIQNKSRQQPQTNERQNNHGPVEHRKLIQRFRQFLADEEKFWTQLVIRLRRSFALSEANPALVTLGILSDADNATSNAPDGPEARDGAPHTSNGRNHFQFPPEDTSTSLAPTSADERSGRLAIMSKALICLGDIARYRELYNESGGRPRAGQEDAAPNRRGRNRRGGAAGVDAIPRPRNYDKARQCYEQARLLVPYEGNPSHQLAILSSYQKDSFQSLVHYYRALCVRQPYDTAAENLSTVLAKALEQWNRTRREREKTGVTDALPPRVKIEAFKEKIAVLHALWKVGMEKGTRKMDTVSHAHHRVVYSDFFDLVSERHLPIDMISSTIVLSQGALWKHRMIRESASPSQTQQPEAAVPRGEVAVIIEWRILDHLLDLHRALLEVGKDQLRVPPPKDAAANDLAQRITATFRRTLPALRIASKWLRANFGYMIQDQEFIAYQETKNHEDLARSKGPPHRLSAYSRNTRRFWEIYAEFLRALSHAFPAHKLPSLTSPLEEDIEMRGFLPLKKMMGEAKDDVEGGKLPVSPGQTQEQVHPNDWQLMRIADLLNDAKELANMEDSPIQELGGHIVINTLIVRDPPKPSGGDGPRRTHREESVVPALEQTLLANIRDTRLDRHGGEDNDDDNMTEITSRTDDDVLRDAFKFLDTSTEDDEEDQIVWDPRAPVSPVVAPALPSPTSRTTPVAPVRPLMSPPAPPALSPARPESMSPFLTPIPPSNVPPTTAQDLLNDVISGRAALSHLESSAPQPALLFGSELSHRHGQNIWSASQDEQSLKFTAQPNHNYQPRHFQGPPSQDTTQSIWSSSYLNETQNSQHNVVGALPTPPYAPLPHVFPTSGHQRTPSSVAPAQHFPTQYQSHHDPFSYSNTMPQQPIHRPDIHAHAAYLNSPLMQDNGPGMYYGNPPLQSYHTRHLSLQDHNVGQGFEPPPMSQVWGNTG